MEIKSPIKFYGVFDHLSPTELYFNVIYVIHANEQTEQASCGLHVNVWNFL